MTLDSVENIMRDLHPFCEHSFRGLAHYLKRAYENGSCDRYLRPVEGFRTPRQQEARFAERPVVEHRGKWMSPHSYGFAVQFAPMKPNSSGIDEPQLKGMSGHDEAVFLACTKQNGLIVSPHNATTVIHPLWYLAVEPLMIRRDASVRP